MWIYVVLPVISGLIGWFTNWVAVKMLFYPKIEKKIFFITFHGIFPKRKSHLAMRLGVLVSRELFSAEVIREKVNHPGMQEEIKASIEKEIGEYIAAKVKESNPLVATFINEKRQEQIRDKICAELDSYIPKMMEKLADKVGAMDVEKIVTDKVNNFSTEKLEDLMMGVMKQELKFIEIAGGVLGFMVGLIQNALILAQEYFF